MYGCADNRQFFERTVHISSYFVINRCNGFFEMGQGGGWSAPDPSSEQSAVSSRLVPVHLTSQWFWCGCWSTLNFHNLLIHFAPVQPLPLFSVHFTGLQVFTHCSDRYFESVSVHHGGSPTTHNAAPYVYPVFPTFFVLWKLSCLNFKSILTPVIRYVNSYF